MPVHAADGENGSQSGWNLQILAALVTNRRHDQHVVVDAIPDGSLQKMMWFSRWLELTAADVDHVRPHLDRRCNPSGQVELGAGGDGVIPPIAEDWDHDASALGSDAGDRTPVLPKNDARDVGPVPRRGTGFACRGCRATRVNLRQPGAVEAGMRYIHGAVKHGYRNRRVTAGFGP